MATARKSAAGAPACLLLSCEHGGNRVPSAYAHLFRGAERVAFTAWFYPTRLASWFGYLLRGDTARADAIFRGTFGRLAG